MLYMKVTRNFDVRTEKETFEFMKGKLYPIEAMVEDTITVKVEDPTGYWGGRIRLSMTNESNFVIVAHPKAEV
ncbi:hypothetical protein [Bacillus sp. FJAT-52991]|uniref:Uncharacterized protein n=1 Tax=Bacillus kandeliae TaxID=3129297 RepID=A0ABZ2N557_9BACI